MPITICSSYLSKADTQLKEYLMERSLVIIKPDGVRRKVIGDIISRFENHELSINGLQMLRIDRDLAARHYKDHTGQPYFEKLMNYITSDRSVIMILEGENAVSKVRTLLGSTDPAKADLGTIRKDYGTDITINVVHGSDSPESAEREISLFFKNS